MRKKIRKKKSFAMFLAMTLVMSNISQVGIMADEGKIKEGTLEERAVSLSDSSEADEIVETIGDYECYILDDGVAIKRYNGTEKELTVPATLGEYKVISIGNSAFYSCSRLTSVTISEGITSIGDYVFENCSNLMSVTIPKGVISIGKDAFWGCVSLTSVAIPEGVTSIGDYVFENCSNLMSVTIPEGVTSIGAGAFYGCSSLTSVNIPKGVTSIGNSAFERCSSLSGIVIPEGVISIDFCAFQNCSSLTSVTISKGVTSIGDSAFYGCSSLTSVTIPEGVTSIGDSAFHGCSSLTRVTIPKGVTSIGCAFSECTSLSSINIPEGITSIADGTFINCISLRSIVIPEGVTSIGDSAFVMCSSLTSVTIPEGVISISDSAFLDCSSLTSVNIPEGMTSIGNWAFSGCSSLTSIKIPSNVTSIGSNVFGDCDKLVISCYKESCAHKYAVENNIKYKLLSENQEETTENPTTEDTSTEKSTGEETTTEKQSEKETTTEKQSEKETTTAKQTEGETTSINKSEEETTTEKQSEKETTTGKQPEEETTKPVQKKTQSIKVTKSYTKTYGSKAFKLSVKRVKGNGKITYSSSNKKVATVSSSGKVTVKGTGICTITVKAAATDTYKSTSAKITITVNPKKNTVSKVKVSNKTLTVSWKKDTKGAGYELQYSTAKSFSKKQTKTVDIKKNKTTSYNVKKLTEGKTYYVRVRTYQKVKVSGKTKKLYGGWSAVKSIKIKKKLQLSKTGIVIKKGNSTSIKVKGKSGAVKWESSNSDKVIVDNNGNIKALDKGTAKITAKVGKEKLTCKVFVYLSDTGNEEIDNKVHDIIKKTIKADMSTAEKVKAIHDYMVLNCKYDYDNYLNGTIPDESYNAEGVILKKTAVCSGYAKAFKVFMDALNIPCEEISGTTEPGPHGWNLVKVDGNWYHMDVTWDDPVSDKKGEIWYDYFLIPDNVMDNDHEWDRNSYKKCDASSDKFISLIGEVSTSAESVAKKMYDGFVNNNGKVRIIVPKKYKRKCFAYGKNLKDLYGLSLSRSGYWDYYYGNYYIREFYVVKMVKSLF